MTKEIHIAPIQGHTDAAWRHFHSECEGTDNLIYYTPFIRMEQGGIRNRDERDVTSSLNDNHRLIPQIIFRDEKELYCLVEEMRRLGAKEIDLNMGCPFPLQTGHGRGAATIANPKVASAVREVVTGHQDISFSVKMRLGMTDPEEWRELLPVLNDLNLRHVAIHPRVAKQQYGGDLKMDQFENFLKESKNKVIFNGLLDNPDGIKEILDKYESLGGVMLGRGVLGRPSLAREYAEGIILDKSERLQRMLDMHRKLYHHYSEVLCGDNQIVSKIKTFWEYAESEIGRKAWKAINKASNVAKYNSAVAMIGD